jgi:hypothetical protein
MTSDDIMQLVLDAGIRVASVSDAIDTRNVYVHELERFAALVAAAEREKCAHVCLDQANAPPGEGREMALFCAAAIRARGRE